MPDARPLAGVYYERSRGGSRVTACTVVETMGKRAKDFDWLRVVDSLSTLSLESNLASIAVYFTPVHRHNIWFLFCQHLKEKWRNPLDQRQIENTELNFVQR